MKVIRKRLAVFLVFALVLSSFTNIKIVRAETGSLGNGCVWTVSDKGKGLGRS